MPGPDAPVLDLNARCFPSGAQVRKSAPPRTEARRSMLWDAKSYTEILVVAISGFAERARRLPSGEIAYHGYRSAGTGSVCRTPEESIIVKDHLTGAGM